MDKKNIEKVLSKLIANEKDIDSVFAYSLHELPDRQDTLEKFIDFIKKRMQDMVSEGANVYRFTLVSHNVINYIRFRYLESNYIGIEINFMSGNQKNLKTLDSHFPEFLTTLYSWMNEMEY